MSPLVRAYSRWVDGINSCAVFFSQLAILGMMLITTYAVVARYFFRNPSIHATEVCVYLLLVATWFSVGYVHRQGRHVRVEVFLRLLNPKGVRVANVISGICILVFCLVLLWAGYMVAETAYLRNYRSTSILRFPLWITYGLIPIGGFLLGLAAAQRMAVPEDGNELKPDQEI